MLRICLFCEDCISDKGRVKVDDFCMSVFFWGGEA